MSHLGEGHSWNLSCQGHILRWCHPTEGQGVGQPKLLVWDPCGKKQSSRAVTESSTALGV